MRELVVLCIGLSLPGILAAAPEQGAAAAPSSAQKSSFVTDGLRDSKESADDSEGKARAALRAAREAVEAAKATTDADAAASDILKAASEAAKAELSAAKARSASMAKGEDKSKTKPGAKPKEEAGSKTAQQTGAASKGGPASKKGEDIFTKPIPGTPEAKAGGQGNNLNLPADSSAVQAKAAAPASMAEVPAPKAAAPAPMTEAPAPKAAAPAPMAEAPAPKAEAPEAKVAAPAPKAEAQGQAAQTVQAGGEKAAAPAPAAPAASGDPAAPKVEGAPAEAVADAPKPKRKSRFGAPDADSEDALLKKGRKPKEAAVPLTPEQKKAAEINAFCDKARAAIKKGEMEVAQGFLESLVAVDLPESEKKAALQQVSDIYEERGDLTKPIAIYEKLCAVLESDQDVPAWLLKLGQLYRDAGAYQMAISRYYGVIQLGMKVGSSDFERFKGLTKQAQREIANTYFLKGDFEQAQKFYNMSLRSDLSKEERAVAMFRAAHCTFMRNDMNGAVNALERFLKDYSRHPSAAEARYMLASAYKALGRAQEAYDTVIELLREAKGKSEADPKAWAFWRKKAGNEFANDYYQRGDIVNAVTVYQALAALETAPEWRWSVVYQMGLCFERLRQEPRAMECYKYIVEENGKPEFRWKKMPQSVGNLVKMAAWRVDQLSWDSTVRGQLRSTAGTEVVPPVAR